MRNAESIGFGTMMFCPGAILGIAFSVIALPAHADEPIRVSYPCIVQSVSDGDTIQCIMRDWPKGFRKQGVRVDGVDTPESRVGSNGAKCAKERRLGLIAKARLKKFIQIGSQVEIVVTLDEFEDAPREKYGRILADILVEGKSARQRLLDEGLARPYDGQAKSDWCR